MVWIDRDALLIKWIVYYIYQDLMMPSLHVMWLIDCHIFLSVGACQCQSIPKMEAPWSRAAPVKLCTRCSRLSRDLAGLVGALTPRGGAGAAVAGVLPAPKLNDSSGAAPAGWPGAGGGGIFGGPPATGGFVGWSWMGRAAGGRLFGSTSSTSEDKSPELNLLVVFVWVGCGCGRWCSSNRVFLIDSVVFQPPDK